MESVALAVCHGPLTSFPIAILTVDTDQPILRFTDFSVVSFDCYGTLIDWETGLLQALSPIFSTHGIEFEKESLLESYGRLESEMESGPYLIYREVLKAVLKKLGDQYGFTPTRLELEQFPNSVSDWLPFPDSVAALRKLKQRYQLAIISNVDDDLFAASAKRLEIEFDWVITAQQVKSYKPSANNFHSAIARIGLPKTKILHAAQSRFHDIAPAKALGLSAVWIHRRLGKEGSGATPESAAIPDRTFPDLESFAAAALSESGD
jgi:2-haloacid dehalogenase